MKRIIKLILHTLFGATFLFLANLLFSLSVPLNLYTVLCTGLFGIPGVILLISMKYIL